MEARIGLLAFGVLLAGLAAGAPPDGRGAAGVRGRGACEAPAIEIQELFGLQVGPGELAFVHLGFSGVLVRAGTAFVMIDPADLIAPGDLGDGPAEADRLILFTHGHGDHFHAGTAVELAEATGAYVLAPPDIIDILSEFGRIPPERLIPVGPGRAYVVGDTSINVIEGRHAGPIVLFRIRTGTLSFFHGGDSGYVPTTGLRSEFAFLPVGRPSPTASPEDALKFAWDLEPRVMVALHGTEIQAKAFRALARLKYPQGPVIIPEIGQALVIR